MTYARDQGPTIVHDALVLLAQIIYAMAKLANLPENCTSSDHRSQHRRQVRTIKICEVIGLMFLTLEVNLLTYLVLPYTRN